MWCCCSLKLGLKAVATQTRSSTASSRFASKQRLRSRCLLAECQRLSGAALHQRSWMTPRSRWLPAIRKPTRSSEVHLFFSLLKIHCNQGEATVRTLEGRPELFTWEGKKFILLFSLSTYENIYFFKEWRRVSKNVLNLLRTSFCHCHLFTLVFRVRAGQHCDIFCKFRYIITDLKGAGNAYMLTITLLKC